MSPTISTTVLLGLQSDLPVDVLRQVIHSVELRGFRVVAQNLPGVAWSHGEWHSVGEGVPRLINLAGAVCLELQPPGDGPLHAEQAAARALGVTWAWMQGALDGWSNAPGRRERLDRYLKGVRAGHRLFCELHIVCVVCGDDRRPENDSCTCTTRERPAG